MVVLQPTEAISLVSGDYESAEITLVVECDLSGQNQKLFFAVVELLPFGTEPSPEATQDFLRADDTAALMFLRRRMTPQEAVDWYRSCAAGEARIPRSDNVLNVAQVAEVPVWPSLILETSGFWDEMSFWGTRTACSRRHHLLQIDDTQFLADFSSDELKNVGSWLKDMLHVNILERPRMWGSASLVLPNPILRSVYERLSATDDSQLSVELIPVLGKTPVGLVLTLSQYQGGGIVDQQAIPISEPYFSVRTAVPTYVLKTEISCPRRGLLYSSGPYPFLKAVSINMGLSSGSRVVQVPATSKTRREEKYAVSKVRYNVLSAGGEKHFSPVESLAVDLEEAKARSRAKESGQKWFSGELDEATKYVRHLIGKAMKRIIFVDPYWAAPELLRFGRVRCFV